MASLGNWGRRAFSLILFLFAVRLNESLKGYEADSWGTEFIFVLPGSSHNVNGSGCHIFGMDRQKDIKVNIEYNALNNDHKNSSRVRKKDEVVIRASHKYRFNDFKMNDFIDGLHILRDYRIHVTSSEKISIIAYVSDTKSATDYFLVHPVGMGGDYYAFSLPGRSIMSLYFLPLGATNQATSQSDDVHSVSITLRQKNKLKIVKQNMKVQACA
ncbi:unnamed protein product [Litomosoides sigmodontis]|uniref:Uncharacterized protein n=1 Tax=Litomosoides sigmodontis TaxID=42156 RepID=A0A3P7K011_LITSI|nr:unnamed protein product [Litomosoides sigmodontis]